MRKRDGLGATSPSLPTELGRAEFLAYSTDLKLALKLALALFVKLAFMERIWDIEATWAPLASTSCALAILAFLAVFKVLIKDFFWIDMAELPA
jgi:hypothetical protein